jgi:flagellar biosynthesis GTPase FlhF
MNVLKKMNIPVNEAVGEASKQKMTINPIHFEEEPDVGLVIEKATEKAKGRPKKSKKVLEVVDEEGDDLISNLLKASKVPVEEVVDEEEAEKKKKEAEEAEKKKREAEEKEAEKKKKEAEKKKRNEEKAAKEAEKKKREAEEVEKKKREAEEAEKKKKEPEQKTAQVKKITHTDGKIYYKSRVGIVYNTESVEVGKWNEVSNEIEFNVEKEDRELSDEEYEEEEELEDLKKDSEGEDEDEDDE